jgi:hypothetical protein
LRYKGFGGPASALASLVIPGTGDYFVTGGKGSMIGRNVSPLVITISSLALIGAGALFKNQSDYNYSLYHSATNQSDINNYYDLSNSQFQAAYVLAGLGIALWVTDIIWVEIKGSNNKNNEKVAKNKMNLTFNPYSKFKTPTFGLNVNF